MEDKKENIIILGTGCAGLTAAIYTARANLTPLLIEGPQPGGQLTTTSEVENFPGFPEGIDGFTLMDNFRKQAERFGTRYTQDLIKEVNFTGPVKQLISDSKTYQAHAVIIATGASPRFIDVPGEKEMFGGKGVTTCATCDGFFYRDMDVVVVGGGDTACEEALFLTNHCRKITLIHRRDTLRASKIMADRALSHPKIHPEWDTVVEAILPDDKGKVRGVRVHNLKIDSHSEIACKGVFIAIGHIPNTQAFEGSLNLDAQGYIITENNSMVRTSTPGIYAAGDCVDHVYRQAITAAGMGSQAAIEAERWIAETSSSI